jgi:uncharacterized protein YjbJ (UPF0337 family)
MKAIGPLALGRPAAPRRRQSNASRETLPRARGYLDALPIDKPRRKRMNRDRIVGAAKQANGAVREAAGNVVGDAKRVAEGSTEKAEGKIQSAVGDGMLKLARACAE